MEKEGADLRDRIEADLAIWITGPNPERAVENLECLPKLQCVLDEQVRSPGSHVVDVIKTVLRRCLVLSLKGVGSELSASEMEAVHDICRLRTDGSLGFRLDVAAPKLPKGTNARNKTYSTGDSLRRSKRLRSLLRVSADLVERQELAAQRAAEDTGKDLIPPPVRTIASMREIKAYRRGKQGTDPRVGIHDLAIKRWIDNVTVDEYGSSYHSINIVVKNLSSRPIADIELPIWCEPDTRLVARASYSKPPAVSITASNWEPGVGSLLIVPFRRSIPPGKSGEVTVEYQKPGVYSAGAATFEWYFGRAQEVYRLKISFADQWDIKELVWMLKPEHPGVDVPPPKLANNTLNWKITFPAQGFTYRMEWRMALR
jgi:hypothetical protein